jgi:acetyl-CoA carboxylase biotin carboxyl carrier protein
MIDLKQLKSLVKLMVANDLTELDLQDQSGERVKLRRGPGEGQVQYVPMPPAGAAPAPAALAAAAAGYAGEAHAAPSADEGLIAVISEMVGTFYTASNPDADPYVKVGDHVDADTVVCIIEAMKVFNEIKAGVRGTIAKVLVESGKAVEFGTPLFMVKP